ncbi:MAG: hypothetical protein CM15mV24_1070 [Bellamyvirus sp.]|nr:MAG: hypothetical protein CM15mV24_1070 [Bellamyvirus sp.]
MTTEKITLPIEFWNEGGPRHSALRMRTEEFLSVLTSPQFNSLDTQSIIQCL